LPACRSHGGFRTSARRLSPFDLAFAEIAPRFPAIAEALQQDGVAATDRDRFALLEPVGRLLQDIMPEGSGADALEAHLVLLHHAYLFWAAQQPVYEISDAALQRGAAEQRMTTALPHPAQYLQLPELRVWGSPTESSAPEPLDGMFVSATGDPGAIAVLAIFGMRPDRPGFSAIGIEGRADPDDPSENEIEIAAAREDGSAPFGPKLPGGTAAGLYSVANAGELLLLTCRLLTVLNSGNPV
jgi:hypothetical protein